MNQFLVFALVCISLTMASCSDPQPNLVILLADDLGYNDLSCYRAENPGQSERPPTCRTPNIDRLASQGMRFTDFYCGAAVCSPSRSALITGRNATRVGIYNWIPPRVPMHLRDEEVTIAEMLGEAGYRCGHFGKWHLTSEHMGQPLPNDQGFEVSFFTFNNANPSHRDPVNFFRDGDPAGPLEGYACQLVMEEAIDWIESVRHGDQPFFANIWFNEPHERVNAPAELAERHSYLKKYYGCIENMDLAIGRLTEYLETNGMAENTLVIFSSDNGSQKPASNDPLRGAKVFNYEGGIRVPFIISFPGRVPSGRTSNVPGSFTDVLPSLATLLKAPLPEGRKLDGVDMSPIFLGKTASVERQDGIFFYRYFHDPVCMLREGDWVLLGYADEPLPYQENYNTRTGAKVKPLPGETGSQWGFQERHQDTIRQQEVRFFELYNIREDIFQKNEIAAAHPERTETMKARMLVLRKEMLAEGGDWY